MSDFASWPSKEDSYKAHRSDMFGSVRLARKKIRYYEKFGPRGKI